jgi:hypothetical protein
VDETACIEESVAINEELSKQDDVRNELKSRFDFAKLGLPFVFIKIELIRNLSKFPLSPSMSKADRLDLEQHGALPSPAVKALSNQSRPTWP